MTLPGNDLFRPSCRRRPPRLVPRRPGAAAPRTGPARHLAAHDDLTARNDGNEIGAVANQPARAAPTP